MSWHRNPLYVVLAAAGGLLALLLIGTLTIWASSRPPAPVVREGKVFARLYDPAHDYTYFVPVYSGQSCSTIGTGSSQTRVCTPIYIQVPETGHVPDRYYLVVQGCPRRKKDAPSDFCQKPKQRKLQVPETTYQGTRVGDQWREAA